MFIGRRFFWSPDDGGGGGGDGSGGEAGGAGGGEGGGGSADAGFLASLPESLRGEVSLSKFGSLEALAQGYVDVEKLVGRTGLRPPADDAPAGEWDQFYQQLPERMRPPESAEGYELGDDFKAKLPEGVPFDESRQQSFFAKAHELKLTQAQMRALAEWDAGFVGEALAALNQKSADETAERAAANDAELRRAWPGSKYDQELAKAQGVVQLGGEALAKELEETGLGNSPHLAQLLAKLHDAVAEDGTLPEGLAQTGITTPAQARAEIEKLKKDEGFMSAMTTSNHPEHTASVQRMQRLQELAKRGEGA